MAVMATDPTLGTRIKRARERKRWTQRQLADALDVNIKSVDNWENGRTSPRASIGALEDVLGISLDQDKDDNRGSLPPSATPEEALERAQRELEDLRQLLREQNEGKAHEHKPDRPARRAAG